MSEKTSGICPYCNYHMVMRVHRQFFEKVLVRKKKYRCANCKKEFYHHPAMTEHGNLSKQAE